jgi:carboxypeptidase Q
MNRRHATGLLLFPALLFAEESVDLNVIHQIKNEAFKKSKVADTLSALTDRYGPRLTGSPEYTEAAQWVLGRAREWGLANGHLEKWGPFGRSWSLKRFSAHLVAPEYAPLIGFPLAWSGPTRGVVVAEPMLVPMRFEVDHFLSDFDRVRKEYAGKLRDKIVMITRVRALPLKLQAAASRYTEAEMAAQAAAVDPDPARVFDYSRLILPEDTAERALFLRQAPQAFRDALDEKRRGFRLQLHDFLRKEGAAGILSTDERGDGGTVFGESAGWHQAKYPVALPAIALTAEHYNRIARLIEAKAPVKVEFEVRAETSANDVEPVNVVAEIPGGAKANELVLVGGHLDSWIGGTGATDNAAGCSVALEAMRILKALNLKLDRTVRLVLWSGEEQGLFGSKAYVRDHFGDPKTMQVKPEHAAVSAYFNLDNGSGKIRGVYLQNNDAARPIFESWLAPFRDLGVTTITIRDTTGTDHLSFDAVGLPGFQFIQDPLEYSSRTHHSNMDVYDHAQSVDLMQAAAVLASVIYHAANRPEKMPRKPLPEPQPAWTPAPDPGTSSGAGPLSAH